MLAVPEGERCLWQHLRAHRLTGEKFKRQHPIAAGSTIAQATRRWRQSQLSKTRETQTLLLYGPRREATILKSNPAIDMQPTWATHARTSSSSTLITTRAFPYVHSSTLEQSKSSSHLSERGRADRSLALPRGPQRGGDKTATAEVGNAEFLVGSVDTVRRSEHLLVTIPRGLLRTSNNTLVVILQKRARERSSCAPEPNSPASSANPQPAPSAACGTTCEPIDSPARNSSANTPSAPT